MQATHDDTVLRWALHYAKQGHDVLPLRPRSKLPWTEHGVHDACGREDDVRRLFAGKAGANLAIACGTRGANGTQLTVFDIDPRNDGSRGWVEFVAGRPLPDTRIIRTGSGGTHIYMLTPANLRLPKQVCRGVDIQGPGRYVVAPPSVHENGEAYEIESHDDAIAAAPQWLVDELRARAGRQPEAMPTEAADAFLEGGRNNGLTQLAGVMRRRGMTAEEMLPSLLAVNAKRCRPPLDDAEVANIARSIGKAEAAEPVKPVEVPAPKNVADLFKLLGLQGPRKRVKTGIATLDHGCRGGIPVPRLVIVGGAPGAGKTTLCTQWALEFARQGARVFFLAVDEGAEGLAFRLAQMMGCNLDRLEEHDPRELEVAYERLASFGIQVAEGCTLEEAVTAWNVQPGDVVIVDSLQTFTCEASKAADTLKGKVDGNVAALKSLVALRKVLCVTTSELARAFYRNREQGQELNPLAAFKESGGIEYAAETALVLVPAMDLEVGAPQEVDVIVAKNRRYGKTPFRLVLEASRATFREIDRPDGENAEVNREIARDEAVRQAIIKAIRTGSHASANSVWKSTRLQKSKVLKSMKELEDEAVIRIVGGRWKVLA